MKAPLPALVAGLLFIACPVCPAQAGWWAADVDKALARAGDNRAESGSLSRSCRRHREARQYEDRHRATLV